MRGAALRPLGRGCELPGDAWRAILALVDSPASVLALSATCKRFRAYAGDWVAACRAQFRVELLECASICLCGHHCSGGSSRRCCRCLEAGRRCSPCAEQSRLARHAPSHQRLNDEVAKQRAARWTLEGYNIGEAECEADAEPGRQWQPMLVDQGLAIGC
ncbi:hypothetical protein T492DRAFT_942538 [Pavlovales sp. CCMP2436]|nr:hypothetical protein T492DRAFT_942538 [Pavlovales sp. CCMP2436]